MSTLTEVREKVIAQQKTMSEIAKEAGTSEGLDFSKVKGHGFDGLDSAAAVDKFKQMNDELSDLADKAAGLKMAEDAAENVKRIGELWERPNGTQSSSTMLHPGGEQTHQAKSLGEIFTESDSFKSFVAAGGKGIGADHNVDIKGDIGGGDLYKGVKTVMTTAAGWAPQSIRTGQFVDAATAPIDLLDLIPGETTNQASVVYMQETTFTNNAIETDEGTASTAAALALTERTSPVRKISVYLPVTDEQLEDIEQAQAYINNRLPYMVRQRLNLQVLKGAAGSGPSLLEGLQVRSGIGSLTVGTDNIFDAIMKVADNVTNTGQATPDAVVLNASDWLTKFRLARTPDGLYILGNPNDASAQSLWGMKVVPTQQQTAGTALGGAFGMYSGLAVKRNLTMSVGFVNDDFKLGQQSIKCEMRVALQCYRPAAFCKITGL